MRRTINWGFITITLLVLSYLVFVVLSFTVKTRRDAIVSERTPVTCHVLEVHCKSSTRNTSKCKILFNEKEYSVGVSRKNCESIQTGINSRDFYYDDRGDIIFVKEELNNPLLVAFVFVFIVLMIYYIRMLKGIIGKNGKSVKL